MLCVMSALLLLLLFRCNEDKGLRMLLVYKKYPIFKLAISMHWNKSVKCVNQIFNQNNFIFRYMIVRFFFFKKYVLQYEYIYIYIYRERERELTQVKFIV